MGPRGPGSAQSPTRDHLRPATHLIEDRSERWLPAALSITGPETAYFFVPGFIGERGKERLFLWEELYSKAEKTPKFVRRVYRTQIAFHRNQFSGETPAPDALSEEFSIKTVAFPLLLSHILATFSPPLSPANDGVPEQPAKKAHPRIANFNRGRGRSHESDVTDPCAQDGARRLPVGGQFIPIKNPHQLIKKGRKKRTREKKNRREARRKNQRAHQKLFAYVQ
ncbi:hypothetical protein JTE90_001254 [Oedothorax gibbosus]|uniref:Uncharacterized protein n=1 Tax=Oedothorax gibbosus TaxID=931172 RepID=A0AAV6VUT4_9ARAC|nr:hypothetical protein JTE90_001254 [Oedothorax gibbosus]